MYCYIEENGCFTVGFFGGPGNWFPDSDWSDRESARSRVHYLNGGTEFMIERVDKSLSRVADALEDINSTVENLRPA